LFRVNSQVFYLSVAKRIQALIAGYGSQSIRQ
jgi:hypothetical protein